MQVDNTVVQNFNKNETLISPAYQSLSKDYFLNAPNLLTREKLNDLSIFSKAIEKPSTPGRFNSEKHYLDTLKLVLESTHETRNRRIFFVKAVLPKIQKNSFLEVGPGDGSVTRVIAEEFKHLTAVDLNQPILNELETMLPSTIDYLKIEKSVLDIDFNEECYDLAALSHMLYYINKSSWIDVIKKAYHSITKDGLLVIVLGGDDLAKADLIKWFGGSLLGIDELALKCRSLFGYDNVELYASDESFITTSREAMFHIASFMLADANINTDRDELIDFINQNFMQSEVFFEMTTRQKYIIIKKPNHLNRDIEIGSEAMVAFN